jgi:hypothetical protein
VYHVYVHRSSVRDGEVTLGHGVLLSLRGTGIVLVPGPLGRAVAGRCCPSHAARESICLSGRFAAKTGQST